MHFFGYFIVSAKIFVACLVISTLFGDTGKNLSSLCTCLFNIL